jgi:hypothetical protein
MMHLHQRRQGHQSRQLSQQEWQQQCNLDWVVADVCQYPSGDVEEGHIAGAADKEVVQPALGNQQRWQRHNKKQEEEPHSPTQAYIRRNSTKLIRPVSGKFNHPRGALMGRKSFVASTAGVQHAEQQPEKQAGVPTILQVGGVSCCFTASGMRAHVTLQVHLEHSMNWYPLGENAKHTTISDRHLAIKLSCRRHCHDSFVGPTSSARAASNTLTPNTALLFASGLCLQPVLSLY